MFNINSSSGKLILFPGPMFSGKTTKLLFEINKLNSLGFNCLYINSNIDNRQNSNIIKSNNIISTHNKSLDLNNIDFNHIKVDHLKDVNVDNFNVIAIDEGQFFVDIDIFVNIWVNKYNKIVLVSFLDGDFNKKNFGDCYKLFPLADQYTKLQSYCKECLKNKKFIPAPFTKRLIKNNNKILVGCSDIYSPVCNFHYKH